MWTDTAANTGIQQLQHLQYESENVSLLYSIKAV